MAPAPHTFEQSPHSPVVKCTQLSRSMAGTRGTAWGWAMSIEGLASRNWLYAVACCLTDRDATVVRSIAPVGHTTLHAPHTWHWSESSPKAGRISRSAPRPNIPIAPRPMRSLHVFTHRPQRMHLPSGSFLKEVEVTPSAAANAASFSD